MKRSATPLPSGWRTKEGEPLRAADPMRREQAVLAHQAADPPGRGADAGVAQPGPDLAVALAVQARRQDLPADVREQLGIGAGADRTATCRDSGGRGTDGCTMAVDRGAGEAPDLGDLNHAVAPARG